MEFNNKRILIIDDDIDLSMLIVDMLEDDGFCVMHVTGIDEAYNYLENNTVDLILLDINLPDGTGFELCRALRKNSTVPIIFASARTSEDDRIVGLDMGGDDYLSKPYSLKELKSRINSLLRRTYGYDNNSNEIVITCPGGDIVVDNGSHRVTKGGEEIILSNKEFELLYYMSVNKNKVLSKEKIVSEVWGAFSSVELQTLTVHIRWLREKLEEDPSNPQIIKTVWRVGYKLEDNIHGK